MAILSMAALRTQLAAGDTGPLYVLIGADDAEKAAVAGEFADMVDEGLRAFNVERFYGGETKVDRLIDSAMTLPMMSPRRVILVIDGEKLLVPKREGKTADEELERLSAFLESPPKETTVVFVCAALDQRRRVVKLLLKQAQCVDCGSIENAADAEKWVKARAAREGGPTLEPAAVKALVDRAGLDLVRLRAGLERARLYSLGQPTVTADDIRQVVPAGPQAQEEFGIANAVRDGDARGALTQLGAALDAGGVPFVLLGQLRWVAEKLPPPRLRAGVDAVFRTDVALKSSGGDPRTLLERLVVELCGSPRSARRV